MQKNKTAHKELNGMCNVADGYARKASPGPEAATSSICFSCSCAMKPGCKFWNKINLQHFLCITQVIKFIQSLFNEKVFVPMMEKITKPAKKEVPELMTEMINASLYQ